jgi:outer membrane scaffolding protein for murein synthesis (MipA/OmpV family)
MRPALIVLLSAACVSGFGHSRAADLPLWEAGAGVAVIDFPDYRGSDERRTFVLPVPYLVYRGDFLKADRNSVRGEFLSNDRLNLHVGVNGSVPVASADNTARRGMPDLDATLEIGPALEIHLQRSADASVQTDLRLPLRAAVATDFRHMDAAGWVFEPRVNVDVRDLWPGPGWNIGLATGPLFANRRYHELFYGVRPEFATPERPAYSATGGYAGWQWLGAISKHYTSHWIGGFVRADILSGAVFEASPLLRQKNYFAAGFAIAWIFDRSARRVEATE